MTLPIYNLRFLKVLQTKETGYLGFGVDSVFRRRNGVRTTRSTLKVVEREGTRARWILWKGAKETGTERVYNGGGPSEGPDGFVLSSRGNVTDTSCKNVVEDRILFTAS